MRLIVLLTFLCVAAASRAQTLTPLQYNDRLASVTDSLFAKGQRWGTVFGAAYKSGDYSGLKPQRESMTRFIASETAYIKGMPAVGDGSDALRDAMLNFLAFENGMIEKAFVPMEKLTVTSTDEEVKAAIDNLTTLSANEGAELKKVGDAEEAYATKNGFTVEPAKEEEKK